MMKTVCVAPLGPILVPGRQIVVDENGIQSFEEDISRIDSSPTDWEASWIWLDPGVFPHHQKTRCSVFCDPQGTRPGLALFRKQVVLASKPAKVTAWVSGDTKYRLYVNGKMAGRGPAEVGGDYGNQQAPDWWFYDAYDLTPFIQSGENTIIAEVILGPVVQADYSMGQGGFLFQAELISETLEKMSVVSDGTWTAALDEGYFAPYQVDARCSPAGIFDKDFDDTQWPAAHVVAHANHNLWKLTPRQIPPLAELRCFPQNAIVPFPEFQQRVEHLECLTQAQPAEAQEFAVIRPGSPITIWFDFKRELTGHPQLCVEGAAGTVLEIGLQEIAGKDDRVEKFTLRDGWQAFETFELHAVQYLRLTVIFPGGSTCQTPLRVALLAVNFTSFPVQYRGAFACSDALLNAIWQASRWTTQICMQAYHLDSPIHQEGLGCTGDYMIEALVSQAAFGETRLARQDLLRTAYLLQQKQGRMFHTSYSLLFIQMLADYWSHTGDIKTLQAILPAVHQVLDQFAGYIGQSGLVTEAPNYMFMDWVEADGYNLHHPPCEIGQGYLSAFYYKALRDAANLCRVVGQVEAVKKYTERAELLREAFLRELWMEERGLFCDGRPFRSRMAANPWLPADSGKMRFSRHTNALAVAYQLAPAEWRTGIVHRMMTDDRLPVVQPYFMHFMFEALHQAGLFEEYGLREMQKWQALLGEHPSSLKECWDNGDYSHAWGATPAYQMIARILGLAPSMPGFTQITISPCLGNLDWAEGQMPTPFGPIRCRWEHKERQIRGEIHIPAGITANLALHMLAADSVITLNGAPVDKTHLGSRELTFVLPEGDYEVSWLENTVPTIGD